MPLTLARSGQPQIIKKITGNDRIRKHLAALGFVEGGQVTVISSLQGNLIVKVKDARIAVDESLAMRVAV